MLTREDLAEVAVLNTHVDRLAQNLRGRYPVIGELLLEAGDAIYEAGQLLEQAFTQHMEDIELTACSDCGCTVEDGECVCANRP